MVTWWIIETIPGPLETSVSILPEESRPTAMELNGRDAVLRQHNVLEEICLKEVNRWFKFLTRHVKPMASYF